MCFVSYPESNKITCGIALVLTFISSYFIQKENHFKLKFVEKLILLLFPSSYYIFFAINDINYLISPLLIGLIFLVFNLFVFKDLRIFRNNIFFVLITISYTTVFFTRWQYVNSGESERRSIIINEFNNQTQKEEKKQEAPDTSINISSFSFLNLKLDTVQIKTDKPFVFIETWNETCYPCKKAIRDLTPILDTMQNIESYFIYESNKFDKNVFISSTQKEKELSNQNILADYKQEFFQSMRMNAYPVFLIIDIREEKIIFMKTGYGGKASKDMWDKKLEEIAKKK